MAQLGRRSNDSAVLRSVRYRTRPFPYCFRDGSAEQMSVLPSSWRWRSLKCVQLVLFLSSRAYLRVVMAGERQRALAVGSHCFFVFNGDFLFRYAMVWMHRDGRCLELSQCRAVVMRQTWVSGGGGYRESNAFLVMRFGAYTIQYPTACGKPRHRACAASPWWRVAIGRGSSAGDWHFVNFPREFLAFSRKRAFCQSGVPK